MKEGRQLKLWEIQPQQRLATSCVGNSACNSVMGYMKPEGTRCWAVTKVKGLSPEITIVPEADAFHLAEGSILITDNRRGDKNLAGSETTARHQKGKAGTRETQSVSQSDEICNDKPREGKPLQMTLWESDKPIVPRKQGNACGGKGFAAVLWGERDTSSTLRGGQRKSTKLSSLTAKAQKSPSMKFTSLAHLLTLDFLRSCFKELKRGKATGVDGITEKEYEANLETNLKELVQRLKEKRYRPKPLRRVYIPKPKGGRRPLGIPAIEDRIVQMALKKILEAIFEVDFLDVSYGFRPKRSAHQALEALDKAVMCKPVNYIADIDIEKFFDNVDHKWIMKFIRQRIADPNILRLIGRYLRTGVMEEGKHYEVDKGTPQGGILSPLLANIYLHYSLDLWFEKVVKREIKGFTKLIRYADDFVICFQRVKEAEEFEEKLKERMKKFGLRISEEKSRLISFGKLPYYSAQKEGRKLATFDFLGFTHYCTKTRKGKFRLGQKTSKAKFRERIKEMNQWLKRVRNQVELMQLWEMLKVKLIGHFRYYGISGNMPELRAYYKQTIRLAYKWINRRSQKKSYNWEQFKRFLHFNPLPVPKIYHLTYTLYQRQECTAEEPYAGVPHVRFCEGH